MKIHGSIEAHSILWLRCRYTLFPWMKIHGSIEAYVVVFVLVALSLNFHEWKFMAPLKLDKPNRSNRILLVFPWMKIHGSIEASIIFNISKHKIRWFPWMKIHGSIEAILLHFPGSQLDRISMNENSWLHWSQEYIQGQQKEIEISMNENSWLHWSSCVPVAAGKCSWFPWMKIHGSIEASP